MPAVALHPHLSPRPLDRLQLDRVLATTRARLICHPPGRLPLTVTVTATATATTLLPLRRPPSSLRASRDTRRATGRLPRFRSPVRMSRREDIQASRRTQASRRIPASLHTLANLRTQDSRARLEARWALICPTLMLPLHMGSRMDMDMGMGTGMDILGRRPVGARLDGID